MADSSSNIHLTPLRARSRGILVAVLLALIIFAIGWYVLAPAATPEIVEIETTESEYTQEQNPLYILLIGTDSRKGTALYTGRDWEEGQTAAKADVLTLVRVDRVEHVLTFLSVPRDTLSVGSNAKINSWLADDRPERTVQEVEKLTGADIAYYIMVSFTGFENLVDALGGVTIDVPTNVEMIDPATGVEVKISAGPQQLLDGAQALAVASSWENSDELEPLRQMSVRAIEKAMIENVAGGDEESVRRAIALLRNNVSTNIDDVLLASLALNFSAHRDAYTVYMGSGPYQGSVTQEGAWVVSRDALTWQECMAVVDAGGDPNTVVVSLSSGA